MQYFFLLFSETADQSVSPVYAWYALTFGWLKFVCNLTKSPVCLFSLCFRSVYLFFRLSVSLFLLADCLFVRLPVCLFVCLSACLSLCLSVFPFMVEPASQPLLFVPMGRLSISRLQRARDAHLLLCNTSRADHKHRSHTFSKSHTWSNDV